MSTLWKSTVGGVAAAAMIAVGSLAASPASADPGFYGAKVYQVGNRNWKGNKNWNRNWNNGCCYRGWNGNYWIGPAIGFGAGVLLGSVLTAPRYYYAPPPVRYREPVYSSRDAYCRQKYNSYNPYTGMYFGYDGRYHYCRIP